MYTVIERRKLKPYFGTGDDAACAEGVLPRVQKAPGFIGLYLVPDETSGITAAVLVFQSKEHLNAMEAEYGTARQRTLDELGNELVSEDRGETVVSLEAAS